MDNTTISIIVAIDKNNAIGHKNKLLCYLPEDLKRFKRITSNHKVIMGRNTFLSLPNGALPNRTNIVISNNYDDNFINCTMARSIEEVLQNCGDEEVFIIGGEMVYSQFLPLADKLYLTIIEHNFEDADAFFPEINYEEWDLVDILKNNSDEKHEYSYTFADYIKK